MPPHATARASRPPIPADALFAPEHLRDARILIADDDPSVLAVLRRLLERAGYRRVTLTDRGAQVGILCVETDPDLVILDLRMPDRDGFEVVEEVKRLGGGAVPILIVSGEGRSEVMHQALACGARDFLPKPFEAAEALLRIRNLLELRALHTASLADAEARYRTLVEGASDLICQTDAEGVVTYANPSAVELLRVDPVGKPFLDLVHHAYKDDIRTFYCEQLRRRIPSTTREIALEVEGQERWIEQRVQLVEVDGRVRGLSGIARDVTARRVNERIKDELVSVVSHELRTPLTAIRGSLGLLKGGVLHGYPERAARMVDLALANAERLGRLIDDMLDLEKLQSGRMEIEPRPARLREIARESAETVRPLFEQADLLLVVDVPDIVVRVDPHRTGQVLTNLVSNAAKFSRPGGVVWIEAGVEEGDLRLRVRDHGRGIPADRLETIFERFRQVDSSDAREKGGTGLGLPIARKIAEQHGGRLWAESAPGRGSTFTALFPGAAAAA